METVCQPYNNPSIYKVIWQQSSDPASSIKYIFVGYREKDIESILHKMELGKELLASEKIRLSRAIPNYANVIGEVIPNKTQFIFTLLEDFDNINYITEKIAISISKEDKLLTSKPDLLPNNIYLWANPKTITYKYYVDILNFLFAYCKSAKSEYFQGQLNKISGLKMIQIKQIIADGLPEKYKNIGENVSLFKKDTINYYDMLNSDELRALLHAIPFVISNDWRIMVNGTKQFYKNCTDPYLFVANNIVINKEIYNNHVNHRTNLINHFGKIKDNILYMATTDNFSELEKEAKNNVYKFFFPLRVSKQSAKYSDIKDIALQSAEFRQSIAEQYQIQYSPDIINTVDKFIKTKTCENKFFAFQINEENNIGEIDIEYIFNRFRTTYPLIPILRYYKGPNQTINKLDQKYVQEAHISTINGLLSANPKTFLHTTRDLSKSGMSTAEKICNVETITENTPYIQFIGIMENAAEFVDARQGVQSISQNNTVVNCYLYKNGYMIISSNSNNYVDIQKGGKTIKIVNLIIKRINKIVDITSISAVGINHIFSIKNVSLSPNKLVHSNMKIRWEFKNNIAGLFDKFIGRLEKLGKYFHYNNPIKPRIEIFYKSVENFYSEDNINRFIAQLVKNKGGKLNNKDIDKYAKMMEGLFMTNKEQNAKALNFFDDTYLTQNNIHMYATKIMLEIKDGEMTMYVEYLENFSYIKHCLLLFYVILYDIIGNPCIFRNENIKGIYTKPAIDIDLSYDLDIENTETPEFEFDLDEINELEEIGIVEEATKEIKQDKLVLDIKKRGDKSKKMKYTQYMNQMRTNMDPELYKADLEYNRSCPNSEARQPYIVSKTQLESYDPKAFTGYMKYRNNYYICPRIWDAFANKPVSVEQYLKNGKKSPYTGGKVINKKFSIINEDANLIVRRPVAKNKMTWANSDAEKNWPEELKHSGKDAFPGFTSKLIKDKSKLCRPCCFSNPPDDYDYSKNSGMQQLSKVSGATGSKECAVDTDANAILDITQKEDAKEKNPLLSKNENYVKNDVSELGQGRLGLLPANLDLLLNNNQDIFLMPDRTSLHFWSNCFLRSGVIKKNTGNFLYCLASIKEVYNITKFKEILVGALTPEMFITLHNGDLVKIYSSNEILPNISTKQQYNFITFLKESPLIYKPFNLTADDISNYGDITDITDLVEMKKITNKEVREKMIKRKKFILLYQVFSGYQNFRRNIMSDTVPLYYEHLIDFLSRENNTIFPNGVNIMIFDKEINKMQCNPYFKLSTNFIILIKEGNDNFTPVFHITIKEKSDSIKAHGIIKLNTSIDLNEVSIKKLKQHQNVNQNLIEHSKHRSKFITKLFSIHQNICKLNLPYISSNADLTNVKADRLIMKGYVITNSMKIQYLLLESGHLLPVYPFNVELNLPVYLLTEIVSKMKLDDEKLEDLWQEYTIIGNKIGTQYKYNPVKILTNLTGMATGILFDNKLIVPIMTQKIPSSMSSIATEKSMVYSVDFENIVAREEIQIHQLLYQDIIYQQFKYEFTGIINDKLNYVSKMKFVKIMDSRDLNIVAQLTTFISKLMKPYVSQEEDTRKHNIMPGITLGRCNLSQQKKKCKKNPFCTQKLGTGKGSCQINMADESLELFSYLLSQDLYNSKNDYDRVLSGLYVPNIKLGDNILSKTAEIISTNKTLKEDIKYIKIGKYRKNLSVLDLVAMGDMSYIINNQDISRIEKINQDEIIKQMEFASSIVAGIALDYIIQDRPIIATPFDADGNINVKHTSGPCIFPFIDTSTYNLKYNCIHDNKKLLICPTAVDLDKKGTSWGYCPEDPEKTRKRLDVVEIKTVSGKGDFISGDCKFPFMKDNYKLLFSCQKDKNNNGQEYSWCPVKLKKGDSFHDKIPVAARDINDIWTEKWRHKDIYTEKSNTLNPLLLKASKKGYCQPPTKLDGAVHNASNELTLSAYNPILCRAVPTKGGYTKPQLYQFGLNVLKIPNSQMRRGDVYLPREHLCKIINDRVTLLKGSKLTDKDRLSMYQKDIDNCKQGESKGGYKLHQLKNIATQYFNLEAVEAMQMKKDDVCEYLVPIIKDLQDKLIETEKETKPNTNTSTKNMIEYFDIKQCKTSPNRSGYKLKAVQQIAQTIGIPDRGNKFELCDLIAEKLNNMKNGKMSKKNVYLSSKKRTYRIGTKKLKAIKSLDDDNSNNNDDNSNDANSNNNDDNSNNNDANSNNNDNNDNNTKP